MSEKHLFIVTCHTIGVAVEDEPASADCIIDEKILSTFEVFAPRVQGRLNGVDVSFTCAGCFRQSYGCIRVVRGLREESE